MMANSCNVLCVSVRSVALILGGGVRLLGEVGGLVPLRLERTHTFDIALFRLAVLGIDVMSRSHCTHPNGGLPVCLNTHTKKTIWIRA